ncbi:GRB2-associated-binding protein 1-like [Micropterus dolomieu]|uniref:GRB2-associated-binding protein 1-like n=1 Tax=Micropterus dolomieu TaxID=147949 RepID=UPI001E8DACE3|nr:GRB2-associated-binding protein 1-like [Micropterus dolomieu]
MSGAGEVVCEGWLRKSPPEKKLRRYVASRHMFVNCKASCYAFSSFILCVSGYESLYIPQSLSDRASMFEFSESFSSYFFNKGMVPLGSVCSEDDDVDEHYVLMSAATTEPPVAPRVPPPPSSDPSVQLQDANYVPMTPLTPSLPIHPTPATGDLASLGRQVPPPAHMGFRNSPLTPVTPLTPPLRRNTMNTVGGKEPVEAMPPPIHRNLKPHRRVKPPPLDISPVQQHWQEVPPPIRSPVTRTFTRDPSSRRTVRPTSAHSSSPSSDSDEPDDSYVAMTSSGLSFSAGEQSLRLMLHRASEGGVSSPLLRRARGNKQVEYLDLDLHTGRSTPTRQKRCTAEGGSGSNEQAEAGEERARGQRTRVDYVVVDPKRTKALRSTREAWHDGRMSTEKEKCSLRLMLHRASEGGVSSPLLRRARGNKQVEYLDLDLHTGRSTPTRQKRCTAEGGSGSNEQAEAGEERARGQRTRVDYVVVDPKRTKALRSTREAWHDGRMSTEKEKC